MNTINLYNTDSIRLGNKTLYNNIINRNNQTLQNNNLINLQNTRYFSGVDASIYFGNVLIDEATNISFEVRQNSMPIFGYNSFVFDVMAQGSRYIQGTFTINFTKSSYLYEILNSLSPVDSGAELPHINPPCNRRKMNKNDSASMWDKCFDIVLSYGNYKVVENDTKVNLSTVVVLRGVFITGCIQNYGTSSEDGKRNDLGGIPISETYTFYARDIDYDTEKTTYSDKEEIQKYNDNEVVKITKAISISDLSVKLNTSSYKCELYGTIIFGDKATIKSINCIINNKYNINLNYNQDTHIFECIINGKEGYMNNSYREIYNYINQNKNNRIDLIFSVSYIDSNEEDNNLNLRCNTLIQ